MTSAHTSVYACDTRNDGNPIYTEYYYGERPRKVFDPNGSAPGCGWARPGGYIGSYRVCMALDYRRDQCTSWTSP